MKIKLTNFKYIVLLLITTFYSQLVMSQEKPAVDFAQLGISQNKPAVNKEQVLDFSAGVIEGELNRPSILMELGSNFKDFNDLVFLRENFNSFHAVDTKERLRFVEEKK